MRDAFLFVIAAKILFAECGAASIDKPAGEMIYST